MCHCVIKVLEGRFSCILKIFIKGVANKHSARMNDFSVWSHHWEASESLLFLLQHSELHENMKLLELGSGTGRVALEMQKKCTMVASDGVVDAVEAMRRKGIKNSILLDWSDEKFADSFDLIFGSDLCYEAGTAHVLNALLKRLNASMLLFTSPPMRMQFFDLVELLKLSYATVVFKRIEAPNCEPAVAVVCHSGERSKLFASIVELMERFEKQAAIVLAKDIPHPPPPPPL